MNQKEFPLKMCFFKKDLFQLQFLISVVLCLVAHSCVTLCDPMDCSPPGSSVKDSVGKNGVSYHALLQGVFPTYRSNPGLPHCRILYHMKHQGAQEYWGGYPIPSPGDYPHPGIKLGSPTLQVDSLPAKLLRE